MREGGKEKRCVDKNELKLHEAEESGEEVVDGEDGRTIENSG